MSDEILDDHRWQRTTLVPPMVDAVGESLKPVKWSQEQMPEFLWIALLYRELGGRQAVGIIKKCSEEAEEISEDNGFLVSSDYLSLSDDELEAIKENLSERVIDDLSTALGPINAHYPSFPQRKLCDEIPDPHDSHLEHLADIVHDMSDRTSELATHVQGIYIGSLMATGQLVISEDQELTEINDVFQYPETEQSRKMGSIVRAATKANTASKIDEENDTWVKDFWKRGYEITDCIFPPELQEGTDEEDEYPQEEFFEALADFGYEYDQDLRSSLLELWQEAEYDPEFTGKNEVLDGLLLRQVNLVTNLATTPQMWSYDISHIVLRCMTENQITLEWFNQNCTEEDYQAFIKYGLGQEKLMLEHMSNYLSGYEGEKIDIERGIEEMEEHLDGQRYRFLTPVDVGHWADKNTRELAQEAGCKDLYDLRFNQYSAAVHAQWNFIEKTNVVRCHNPLHQYHKIPDFRPVQKVPFAVVEGGNLMNRSIDSWMQARDIGDVDFEIYDLAGTVKEFLLDRSESKDSTQS